METWQNQWRSASRGILHKSPTITDGGVLLGYGTVLVHRSSEGYMLDRDTERFLCLLSIAQRRAHAPAALHCMRRALASWRQGDKALAHIHLAFGRLPRIESVDEARCLHQAEWLIDLGMAPVVLAKEFGFDLKSPRISKTYNPDEPRNPKDEGDASGEWTKDPVASGSIAFAPSPIEAPPIEPPPQTSPLAPQGQTPTSALAPAAPSLVDVLGADALAWLRFVVGRLALPVSLFGALFVPSPNEGTSEQGSVPGRPGMSYSLDRDTGTLRLSLDSDPDPDHALVARLGTDGIYRDVDTSAPIARAVGSKAVLIDLDLAPLPSGGGAAGPDSDRDEPKLCPDPSKDQGGGRKLFDILYEQFVRNHVNPQRKPQLPPGIAFALPADTKSGWVHYDDCREATGGMIEAKGNYAEMLDAPFKRDWLKRDWLGQAARQIKGARGRAIDWYFHDQEAAAFARKIFTDAELGLRIGIHVLPYAGGVPKDNPRIR